MSVKRKEYITGANIQIMLESIQNYVLKNPKFSQLSNHQVRQVRKVVDILRNAYKRFSSAYSMALGNTIEFNGLTPKTDDTGLFVFKNNENKKAFLQTVRYLYDYKFEIYPVHFLPKNFFDGLNILDYELTGLSLLLIDYEVQ